MKYIDLKKYKNKRMPENVDERDMKFYASVDAFTEEMIRRESSAGSDVWQVTTTSNAEGEAFYRWAGDLST